MITLSRISFPPEISMSPSSEEDPFDFQIPPASNHIIKNENGVFKVYEYAVGLAPGEVKYNWFILVSTKNLSLQNKFCHANYM